MKTKGWAEVLKPGMKKMFVDSLQKADLDYSNLFDEGPRVPLSKKQLREREVEWDRNKAYADKLKKLLAGKRVKLSSWERKELKGDLARADDY